MPSGYPRMGQNLVSGTSIPSGILPGNGAATPESVKRRRRLAESLMQSGMDTSPVESPWQAVGRIGQAAIGGYSDYQAGQQEEEGRQSAQAKMAELLQGGNPDNASIMEAMNNPWLTDGQGRLASALMEQNFKKAQPDWQTFTDKASGDVFRWNQNDQNAKPEMFYDAAPAPQDLMNVGKGGRIYDPNTQTWVEQPAMDGAGVAPADIDDTAKITKMYENAPGVSRYRTVVPSLRSMQESLKDNSAISDLDFVYGVAKILDPESVVRESETGMVIESQSLSDQVVGQLNKLMNGEAALTARVRKDLFKLARRRGDQLKKQAEDEVKYFHEFGQGFGVAPQQFRALDQLPQFDETQYPDDAMAPPQINDPNRGVTQFDLMMSPQKKVLIDKYGLAR